MEQLDFVAPDSPPVRRRRRHSDGPSRPTAAAPRSNGPREGYRRLTADIPADLHKRLKMQALMEERTVTDIILYATRAWLSQR